MSLPDPQPDDPQADDADERERARKREEQIRRNQAALAMLDEWDQEAPEEQRETIEFLMRALDEDRTEEWRRIVPPP
jgi:hypothetical protein